MAVWAVADYTLVCVLLCMCSLHTVAMGKREKLHLSYYTHEVRGGEDNTLLLAAGTAQGGTFSNLAWGSFVVFDNLINEGPEIDSQLLGKITGTAVVTTKQGPRVGGVQMVGQHVFGVASPYNGSSFTFIPGGVIPGGTGYFQGYHGYGGAVDITTAPPVYTYKWDIHLFQFD